MAIACLFAARIMEKYGRKSVMRIASLLFFVCWMILYFSANFYHLLFGRFVTGFCAGLTTPTVAVYVGEITQPSYRGLFLPMIIFGGSLGTLMPHVLGIFLKWQIIAVISALLPLLWYLLVTMIPESPPWLVRKGRIEEAAQSFTWLRGQNSESVDEFNKMVERQKLTANLRKKPVGFNSMLTIAQTESFYKPLLILLVYATTLQLSGLNVIIYYSATMLKDSLGEHINEYVATIILDVSRLTTSMVACAVVKNVGRRSLTAFSGLTTTITLFGLSAYLQYASTNEQLKSFYGIPLALFMLNMISVMIGLYPLLYTLTEELFPSKYRAFGSSFVILFNYVCTFAVVKVSPTLFLVLGEQGGFLLFGTSCFIGTIVIMVFLPETHKKTLQEIEDTYHKTIELQKISTKDLQQV